MTPSVNPACSGIQHQACVEAGFSLGGLFPAALQRTSGFTLLEVMISIIVMSIGILGVSKLQIESLRTSQQATYAASAAQLAQDMAERIRANNIVSDRPDANNHYLDVDTDDLVQAVLNSRNCYVGANCTPDQIALMDVREWATLVRRDQNARAGAPLGLPGGRGVICRDDIRWEANRGFQWACNDTANAPLVIKLGWRAKNADGTLNENAGGGQDSRPSVVIPVKPLAP